jgi:hypothetical protein
VQDGRLGNFLSEEVEVGTFFPEFVPGGRSLTG